MANRAASRAVKRIAIHPDYATDRLIRPVPVSTDESAAPWQHPPGGLLSVDRRSEPQALACVEEFDTGRSFPVKQLERFFFELDLGCL